MAIKNGKTFGLIKTRLDAHTMGIHAAAALLRECGYRVLIAPPAVENAVERIVSESSQELVLDWISTNGISQIAFSYRLDPERGVDLFGRFVHILETNNMLGNQVETLCFAGLMPACQQIEKEFKGRIATLRGGEAPEETLRIMGVSNSSIPERIKNGSQYDKDLQAFGENLIKSGEYKYLRAPERNIYPEYGTERDTIELRIKNNYKDGFQPIIRAHSGPYSEDISREECLAEYQEWCKELAESGYLDVLSIGSSQLSQSNFGENWDGMPNGGGVPVNSEWEYVDIWKAARPMLVRTYSGTRNVRQMADLYERSIHISWHALSLWWFNELDGRGPNSLLDNLREHIETIRFIASKGKPVETNVPHHFAFRGCDDVTYVLSGYLAAKAAKECGISTFILQNMLNTPRSTWGVQDLAKSRTLLKLVKELEDEKFTVLLQCRAGLDYFKPDLDVAKAQLASVTAMMDDIDPNNIYSPEIIHVVSYSEALFLATPSIINDSIKITRTALKDYRQLKKKGLTPNVFSEDILIRQKRLEDECRLIIKAMEDSIPDLYSPEGLYIAFIAGWLPVPELWNESDEFVHAKSWETRMENGGVVLFENGHRVSAEDRINKCIGNMIDANLIFKNNYTER